MDKYSKGMDLDTSIIPTGSYTDAPNLIPEVKSAWVVTDPKGIQHSENIALNKDREMEMCFNPKVCKCSALNVRRNKKCWNCGEKLANIIPSSTQATGRFICGGHELGVTPRTDEAPPTYILNKESFKH